MYGDPADALNPAPSLVLPSSTCGIGREQSRKMCNMHGFAAQALKQRHNPKAEVITAFIV